MGRYAIVTPAISIARQLWRYGEPELAERAAALDAVAAAEIGERAGAMCLDGTVARIWPDGPRQDHAAVMLAAIELLEGRARPCPRTRRLPQRSLPDQLQRSEDDLWAANRPVSEEMDRRLRAAPPAEPVRARRRGRQ